MTQTNQTSITSGTIIANRITTSEPFLPDLEVTTVNKEMTIPVFSAALPGGEAYVLEDWRKVVKINNTGQTVKVLYDCV